MFFIFVVALFEKPNNQRFLQQAFNSELGVFSVYDVKKKRPFCNAFTGKCWISIKFALVQEIRSNLLGEKNFLK